jgi:hypothetical protein
MQQHWSQSGTLSNATCSLSDRCESVSLVRPPSKLQKTSCGYLNDDANAVQQHPAASVKCQQVVDDLRFKRVRSDLEILPGVQIDPFKLKSGNRQVIFILIGARSHVQKHRFQSETLSPHKIYLTDVKVSL